MDTSYSYDRCIVCNGNLGITEIPSYARCDQCGFLTKPKQYSDQHFVEAFGEDYFQGAEYGDYLNDKPSLQANFRRRLNIVRRHVDTPNTHKLFEVGCAHGFSLELARDMFAKVRGIDISSSAIEYARKDLGLDAYCGDYLEMDIAKGFDTFCFWDCIGNLKRPDLYLQKVSEDITPGCILAVSAGDAGSFNMRFRGGDWRLMKQSTLFHQFSRQTLSQLMERCGFTVIDYHYPAIWRSAGAICRPVPLQERRDRHDHEKLAKPDKSARIIRDRGTWHVRRRSADSVSVSLYK